MLMVGAGGICCFFADDLLAGIIMTLAGFGGSGLFLYPEISERQMVRRMRNKNANASPEKKGTG
jgi:hypothetical protein